MFRQSHHRQQEQRLLLLLLLLHLLLLCRVPFRSGGHRGETPEGRRTGMCAVRGRGRARRKKAKHCFAPAGGRAP
ncbi:hypothetical protein DYQ93_06605 [Xanthomonas sp. LMG 8992]|nr:hypothetical protein [Xanthomonas sp. LMG 8992]